VRNLTAYSRFTDLLQRSFLSQVTPVCRTLAALQTRPTASNLLMRCNELLLVARIVLQRRKASHRQC
jgi:hypothetical protein